MTLGEIKDKIEELEQELGMRIEDDIKVELWSDNNCEYYDVLTITADTDDDVCGKRLVIHIDD